MGGQPGSRATVSPAVTRLQASEPTHGHDTAGSPVTHCQGTLAHPSPHRATRGLARPHFPSLTHAPAEEQS